MLDQNVLIDVCEHSFSPAYLLSEKFGKVDRSDRQEETFFDIILEELEIGEPGLIGSIDPDVLIAVETVSDRARLSSWTGQDLQRYPWLRSGLTILDRESAKASD